MGFKWTYKRAYWKVRSFLSTHFGVSIKHSCYNGRQIMSIEDTGAYVKEKLLSGEKFAAGRIGGSELKVMISFQSENKDMKLREKYHNLLMLLSGFFGDMNDLEDFDRLMERSIGSMDLMGVWFNQMEDVMLERYGAPHLKYGFLEGLEPWYCPDNPWSSSLKGKKVLVIHPYAESIEKQYRENREKIFPGTDILPEFELQTIKAVQTLYLEKDERFAKWTDALYYMCKEAMKREFDVALVGCGAYGLPLAAFLADNGKSVIHMGGSLQLLFGIRGKRWDEMELLKPYYSDAWIRPSESENLGGREKNVENGCYW